MKLCFVTSSFCSILKMKLQIVFWDLFSNYAVVFILHSRHFITSYAVNIFRVENRGLNYGLYAEDTRFLERVERFLEDFLFADFFFLFPPAFTSSAYKYSSNVASSSIT